MKKTFHNWTLRILIGVVCSVMTVGLYAVPAYRGWLTMEQPDGTTIEIRQVGDEFYHYAVNRDGKQVRQNAEGYWEVVGDAPTVEVANARRAKAVARRAPQAVGTTPNLAPRGLLILANFKDCAFNAAHTQAVMNELCNSTNCTVNKYENVDYGSAAQFFADQSNNTYRPVFDVFGPVTLSQNTSYYGANDDNGDDEYSTDAVIEACILANQQYSDLNFANYNSDGDSYVDFVYVIYAGKGEADGGADETIWPHNYEIQQVAGTKYSHYTKAQTKLDGLYLNNYACSGELCGWETTPTLNGIGTFCHEFGHVIGLPDFYDTKYGDNYYNAVTPNDWDLMDGGGYNGDGHCPPNYSPWEKQFFGWLTPINLGTDGQNISLTANGQTGYQAYQINSSNTLQDATTAGECYYLENRQQQGWDTGLPSHGMLIWKVNFNSSKWNSNTPNNTSGSPCYTILSASGNKIGSHVKSKTENNKYVYDGPKNPYPGSAVVRSVTPISGHELTEISESARVITFKYNGGQTKTECTYTLDGEHCTFPLDGVVAYNGTLNLTITPDEGYTLADASCWMVEMGLDNELVYGEGFTYNASTNVFRIEKVTDDVTILVEGKETFNITWMANGVKFAETTSAGSVVLPEGTPDACEGKVFVGWCATANYESATTAPTFVKNGDKVMSATTFYAVFATQGTGGGAAEVQDQLTRTITGVSGTSYSNWKNSTSLSGATYVGNSAGGNSSIQLRSNESSSGIVTTTSGGKIKKVVVTWNENTAGGRILDVYGKNTAYSSPADLYGSDAGTKLGSIERNSQTELTISGDYTYIGVRSHSGAMYLDKITFIWESGGGISYSDYTTSCGAPAEKYAIQINSTEHGSLSTSPSGDVAAGKTVTVTATPETHYHLATLTVKDASNENVTVNGTGNTRTFTMPEKAVTISATFAQDDKYTINFYVGNNIQKTESLFAGETATAPSVVAPCEDYTHVGWVTNIITTETESAPTTVPDFTVNGAQNYYAVFSRTEEGESGNQEITLDATKDTTFPKDGITLSTTNGVLNNGSDYRIYKGAKLTITSTVGDMSSIVFTFDGTYNGGGWATSYTPNAATWTSPACTSGDSGKQARIKKIIITIGSGASSTTYYTTAPNCEECTNAVTVTKGTESHGSFALDKMGEQSTCGGKVVVNVTNISPADGYRFKEIKQVGLTEGVTIDQTAKTVTYAKKVNGASTINVLFEEIPTYLVRFYDNGTMVSEQEVLEGQSAEKPNNPTPACSQYTFVGWWTAELAADNTEEETWITDFTATKKQDYYAVYSLIEKGEGESEIAYMTFNTNSSDGSTEYTTTLNILNHVVASHNGLTSCEGSKLYDGIGGVKLGSSSSRGYITLTLTASASIKKVIVNASQYGSDSGKIEVEAGETSLGTQEPNNNLVFEATTPIETNQVTVSTTSKRAYVKSIYIYAGDKDVTYYTSVMDCSVTPTGTVTVEDQTKAQKILRDGQLLIIRDGKTYNSLGHIIE